MVNELLNNIYEVKDDEGETLYENITVYQNVKPKHQQYENAML